ncbi:NAD(P)H-binding protein, partial [Actinoplanes philippinensis]|uniref:NAD(P)H-binding protein n=1 Tax=Actinoplanes philippinensis TaxID=35752 RepID=UPI0033F550AF
MSINVVVLGATGRTGRLIVTEALRNGHQVTAAVRNPASVPAAPGLRVERADVRDADSLTGRSGCRSRTPPDRAPTG